MWCWYGGQWRNQQQGRLETYVWYASGHRNKTLLHTLLHRKRQFSPEALILILKLRCSMSSKFSLWFINFVGLEFFMEQCDQQWRRCSPWHYCEQSGAIRPNPEASQEARSVHTGFESPAKISVLVKWNLKLRRDSYLHSFSWSIEEKSWNTC